MKIFRRPLSALAAITARLAALEKNGVSLPLRLSAQQPITYTLFTVAAASLGYSGPLDAHYRALKAVTFKVLQGATYWPIGNVIQVLDASKTVIASGVWAANPDQQAELPVLLTLDNPVTLAAGADFYLRVLANPAVVDSNRGAGTTSTDGSIKFLDSATMTLPALNFLSGPLLPKQTIQPLDPADFPVVTSAAQLIGAGVALLIDGVRGPRLIRRAAGGALSYGQPLSATDTESVGTKPRLSADNGGYAESLHPGRNSAANQMSADIRADKVVSLGYVAFHGNYDGPLTLTVTKGGQSVAIPASYDPVAGWTEFVINPPIAFNNQDTAHLDWTSANPNVYFYPEFTPGQDAGTGVVGAFTAYNTGQTFSSGGRAVSLRLGNAPVPKGVIGPSDPLDFPIVTDPAQLGSGLALLDDGVAAPRLIRKRADGSVWLGTAFTAPVVGFKSYRLNITSGGDGNYVNIYEVQLRAVVGGPSVAQGGAAFDNGNLGGSYAAANLFDGNNETSWVPNGLPSSGAPKQAGYTFGNAVKLAEYSIYTSSGSRGPHDWTYEGSSDGGATWTVLDTQKGQVFADGATRVFPVANG